MKEERGEGTVSTFEDDAHAGGVEMCKHDHGDQGSHVHNRRGGAQGVGWQQEGEENGRRDRAKPGMRNDGENRGRMDAWSDGAPVERFAGHEKQRQEQGGREKGREEEGERGGKRQGRVKDGKRESEGKWERGRRSMGGSRGMEGARWLLWRDLRSAEGGSPGGGKGGAKQGEACG